jgi:hypothetical protein
VRVGSAVTCVERRKQGADVRADQPQRAFVDDHVGIADLRAPGADRLHLPAGQHEPGLVALLYEVVVERLAVLDDRHGTRIFP